MSKPKATTRHYGINDNIELLHAREPQDSGEIYESVTVAANEVELFYGYMINDYSENQPVLEMYIRNKFQDELQPVEYLQIFAKSAEVMGVSMNQVRPALYHGEEPNIVVARSALKKMRMALGRE